MFDRGIGKELQYKRGAWILLRFAQEIPYNEDELHDSLHLKVNGVPSTNRFKSLTTSEKDGDAL
jgi:hypothetical protein